MVDFAKHVGRHRAEKRTDPLEIYEALDRASDKGPLRPSQEAVLATWHKERRAHRDLILKLHTGQGKTLIGLLALQSKLNEGAGPSVYLCANNNLVEQTLVQAKQFGIRTCRTDDELPEAFLDSEAIFVTSVQKLFNGLTKFGLHARSVEVGSIVLDDAHACLDSIRDSCRISLSSKDPAYQELLNLFSGELSRQSIGTFEDIRNGKFEAFLPVPYWEWSDKANDVARILSKYSSDAAIKFAWQLVQSRVEDCLCVVSGTGIEIEPYVPPLDAFGSFKNAAHRIFMSATINDDSFFIKGLGVSVDAVRNPLVFEKERWSGEKMVLIPSRIDGRLDRSEVVHLFGPGDSSRQIGIVALTPSRAVAELWGHVGARVANRKTIDSCIDDLKQGVRDKTVVVVNRYDGIDLPDDSCRILVIDGPPFSEALIDRYHEQSRGDSEVIQIKLAQKIEQGMGRHIRGEKDYGVVLLISPRLLNAVKSKRSRNFFSPQTREQIEIGMVVSDLATHDVADGKRPTDVLVEVINQCLRRDEGWKEFYADRMNSMAEQSPKKSVLDLLIREKEADDAYIQGDGERAAQILQRLIDELGPGDRERGWYLQEVARFQYKASKVLSNRTQLAAHARNTYLLKPKEGMQVRRMTLDGSSRVERMREWLSTFSDFEDVTLRVDELLDGIQFGVGAERFEHSLGEIGRALGFASQRPDKEWGEGPDNLWMLREGRFAVIECKSDVSVERKEISRAETGQMNNSCAWFDKTYPGAEAQNLMVINTRLVEKGGGFNRPVLIMKKHNLERFVSNVRKFFKDLSGRDLNDVADDVFEQALQAHDLRADQVFDAYLESVRLQFT